MSRIYQVAAAEGHRARASRSPAGSTRAAPSPGWPPRAWRSTPTPPTWRSPTRRPRRHPADRARARRRRRPRLVDCREAHGARGRHRHPVRRLPPRRPAARSTSTPRRSAAPSPPRPSCARCARTASHVFGDGSTHKGNDIQRFYRYGILTNPELQHLQALARSGSSSSAFGGRKEMSEYLDERRPALHDGRREGLQHRRQRARRDARGEGPRAPRQGRCASSTRSWASRTGSPRCAIAAGGGRPSRFERGVPVSLNGKRFALAASSCSSRPTASAAATASA